MKKTRTKKYQYNVNRRKLWKKRTRPPTIELAEIKEKWDNRKSLAENFKSFGLSMDPNKSLAFEEKDILPKEVDIKLYKSEMIKKLEDIVENGAPKNSGVINNLSTDVIGFSEYMVKNYGSNYRAMSKDPTNYFQETPAQIKNKILKYHSYVHCKSVSYFKMPHDILLPNKFVKNIFMIITNSNYSIIIM